MSRATFGATTVTFCLAACTVVAQQSAPSSANSPDAVPHTVVNLAVAPPTPPSSNNTSRVASGIILKAVTYTGGVSIAKDDGSGLYDGPHWQDEPKRRYPYLYRAGLTFAISKASWLMPGLKVEGPFLVRGKGSDDIAILDTKAQSQITKDGTQIDVTNPSTDAAPFPMMTRYFNTFDIRWELSWDDGKSWHDAGISSNPIYVCLGSAK